MKNKYFLCLLLPFLILTSCNPNKETTRDTTATNTETTTTSYHPEEVKILKELLDKQNFSSFYERAFTAQFKQDFNVFHSDKNEGTNAVDFLSYHAASAFGYQYAVTPEKYEEITSNGSYNAFDLMSGGKGDYGLLQSAQVRNYSCEYDEDEETLSEMETHSRFLQLINTKFTQDNFQVDSEFSYTDYIDNSNSSHILFNGLIEKEELLSNVSTDALSALFSSINLYDGPRIVQVIDMLYFNIVASLKEQDDAKIGAFIQENQVTMEENEDVISVTFHLDNEEMRTLFSDNEVFPGIVDGTLSYDKESGEFQHFKYTINYSEERGAQNQDSVSAALYTFDVEGDSDDKMIHQDPYIRPDPVVYDDVVSFMNDMIAGIIPPNF